MLEYKIKNGDDLDKAIARLDEIWLAKPGDSDWEERSALVEGITAYEDENVHIPPPDPIDAILFRMEQGGLRAKDLVPFIGSASKVSEVLNRTRGLSKVMICRLHEGLGIPLASLLGIAPEVPDDSVQVDWVLPSDVVSNVTTSAEAAGISVWEWVTQSLVAIAWASGNPVISNKKAPQTRPETNTQRPLGIIRSIVRAATVLKPQISFFVRSSSSMSNETVSEPSDRSSSLALTESSAWNRFENRPGLSKQCFDVHHLFVEEQKASAPPHYIPIPSSWPKDAEPGHKSRYKSRP